MPSMVPCDTTFRGKPRGPPAPRSYRKARVVWFWAVPDAKRPPIRLQEVNRLIGRRSVAQPKKRTKDTDA